MGELHPLQESFAAGEITPRLHDRFSLKIHQEGVATLINMFPLRHGPAAKRDGTVFTGKVPGFNTGKLFTFNVSPSQNFVVLISDDGNLRVNDESGGILLDNLIDNPFFDDGLTGWTDISDPQAGVIWANGVATMSTNRNDSDAIFHTSIDTSNAPNDPHELRTIGIPGSPTTKLILKVGTSAENNDIDETVFVEGVSNFQFNPGGATTVFLTFVLEGTELVPLPIVWSLDSVTCAEIAGGGVIFAHPWAADDIAELQAEMPPGEDVMFFTAPRVPQQELTFDPENDIWGFTPISFEAPPAAWTGNNFPSCVTFFQGRSWWGGSPGQPATFYASKSGVLRDMTIGEVADDGLEFELSRRGRIEWMEGVKNLLMGTENSEFIITSEGGLIEPGDIFVEQQSAYGSENSQAKPIGNDVLYLSSDGAKLRKIGFDFTQDGFLSVDLTFPAEHMGRESSMREVHFSKDPENLIYNVNAAGNIFVCTYDPNTDFYGWGRMNTDGRILSATVTQSRGSSILWVLVQRDKGETSELFLEKLQSPPAVFRDFLDSNVVLINDPPSTEVTGVIHLANQTVGVVVDKATHRDIELDENGDGTLDFEGARIVVGLHFSGKMVSLPMGEQTKQGSGIGKKKRWNKIVARLLNSAIPLVNGQRQPDRDPDTPMDTTEPDANRDVETRQIGWNQKAQVTIEQDLARALTVTALYGEYNEKNL